MILTVAALLVMAGADMAEPTRQSRRTLIVREQVVIRVPLRPVRALPVPHRMTDWKENRGPRCIDRAAIGGAALSGSNSIDLILRDRTRLRAELESSCPALDYYDSFFMRPTADGRICADRDAIHSRVGGECGIERFRKLTPKRAR